ncbi:hypothetical protein PV11_09287 [Exophiala sideris]|uniref:Enterotoxin n=1 Tax=Exophiala sideris TaxID=1016849 RepID=A0A0D1Y3Y7_9EURO|nr:hypothetical protein PV11_09287 [Exophiala sideris]
MMFWSRSLLAVALLLTTVDAAALPQENTPVDASNDGVPNANHIFNAIHSSMRQWGSSLNHNGMSLFLAQVPAGTQFYHGTSKQEAIEGMEWLAFEPEHAINFARKMGGPPGGGRGGPPGEHRTSAGWRSKHHKSSSPFAEELSSIDRTKEDGPAHRRHWGPKKECDRSHKFGRPEERDRGLGALWPFHKDHRSPLDGPRASHFEHQRPMRSEDDDDHRGPPRGPGGPGRSDPGWLHTYKTKGDLPLIYLDGMSAGKTEKGTLDSQDVLLLNFSDTERGHMFGEFQRADGLCKMAKDTWGGKIRGFIRMEAGFEIILCSFKEDLDFLSAVRAGPIAPIGEKPDPIDGGWRGELDWLKAITARYDGIGGERVKVNYDNFVTGYSYDLDLFRGSSNFPRFENLSDTSLDKIRSDVDTLVKSWNPSEPYSVNWQGVTDMIIERYAKELKYLVSGALSDPENFYHELELLLRVFIDSDARNTTADTERCAAQFIPAGIDVSTSIAGRAIGAITDKICAALFTAFDYDVPVSTSVKSLESLIDYLNWTTWKKCGECPLDKVCFIPIWPFGSKEDYDHPQCRNGTELRGRSGYWGGNFGPPRDGNGPPKHGNGPPF